MIEYPYIPTVTGEDAERFMQQTESSVILDSRDASLCEEWSALRLISTGRLNTLWTANKHGKRYLLKGLRPEFRSSTPHLELLRKEFRIASSLDHPAIVHLLDYGEMEPIGEYIQMEYVDGRTMNEWLDEKPGRNARRRVLMQLLEAMAYLHQKQILHRDLKPANILITHHGDNVRLIDFGIADADDYVALKQAGGTKGYMAPEVLDGKEADGRADIYALGKILSLLFPRRYKRVAAICCRLKREERYQNVESVIRAIQREDNILRYLPWMVVLLAMALGLGVMIYGQQRAQEQIHEQQGKMVEQQEQIREQQAYIATQLDSIDELRASLATYQEEEVLIKEMIEKSSYIFDVRVRKPFRQGKFVYLQDMTEAIETGRREIDQLLETIDNETLRTKAHSAMYDVWVRNNNQFIEDYQPYQLPLRRN